MVIGIGIGIGIGTGIGMGMGNGNGIHTMFNGNGLLQIDAGGDVNGAKAKQSFLGLSVSFSGSELLISTGESDFFTSIDCGD